MTHVATFVASLNARLDQTVINKCTSFLGAVIETKWLKNGIAADVFFSKASNMSDLHLARAMRLAIGENIDIIIQPTKHRQKKLLLADMDSTMIAEECIDELAKEIGVGDQVAHITERAMRGELIFEQALEQRVALLKGLDTSVVDQLLKTKIHPTQGAKELIEAHNAKGGYSSLVSGGFYAFTRFVAKHLGFSETVANDLEIEGGKFTGKLLGVIFGPEGKRQRLEYLMREKNVLPEECVALGDGANDKLMIEGAGLGIAYHAKPILADAADAEVVYGNMDVVRYALGLSK